MRGQRGYSKRGLPTPIIADGAMSAQRARHATSIVADNLVSRPDRCATRCRRGGAGFSVHTAPPPGGDEGGRPFFRRAWYHDQVGVRIETAGGATVFRSLMSPRARIRPSARAVTIPGGTYTSAKPWLASGRIDGRASVFGGP